MSRPSKAVILAEDDLTGRFVYRCLSQLRQFRNPRYDIIVRRAPAGQGSGEQWVREQYANEVKAHRSASVQTALIAVIDADTRSVAHRTRQFQNALAEAGMSPRTVSERIVHLVPRRNIETWIVCLNGFMADEITDYSQPQNVPEPIKPVAEHIGPAAIRFFEWTRMNAPVQERCVPSLKSAIPEVRRLE
jgi:hypothetical protein